MGRRTFTRPGPQRTIADSVGAGYSYTGSLAMGLRAGATPEELLACALRIADFACTQPGAMPPMLPQANGC